MTVAEAIRKATAELEATSDTARLDAELLMAHALGVNRSNMLLNHMNTPMPACFFDFIGRRASHEPVAHIIGVQEFYGREFAVTPDTLIPRGDTEILIDIALKLVPDAKRVLDLGTGSGAILITALLELPGANGVATDNSEAALEIAMRNARALNLGEERAQFDLRDWSAQGWSEGLGKFDLVLSNPPYVEADVRLDPNVFDFEPSSALFAGPEGLDDYRILIPQLRALMTENAVAILEIGSNQAEAVSKIALEGGFDVDLHRDLAGRSRCLVLR